MNGRFIRLSGQFLIAGGILLTLSWCAIPVIVWEELTSGDFSGMVRDPFWIPINIGVLTSQLSVLVGTVGLYLRHAERAGRLGSAGFVLTLVGMVLYCCIQFYETFFWPVVAAQSPDLFAVVGIPLRDPWLRGVFLFGGIPWAAGFIMLGVTTARSGLFSRWAAVSFSVGAVVFGLIPMIPIRTVGVLLLSMGLVGLGATMLRDDGLVARQQGGGAG